MADKAAVAATVAATAAATLAAKAALKADLLRNLKVDADKQFEQMLKTITTLTTSSWPVFHQQINDAGFSHGWHAAISDPSTAIPVASGAADQTFLKFEYDKMNAWKIIVNKTEGHDVHFLLREVTRGDGIETLKTLRENFQKLFHRRQIKGL